jgi:bifunctional non-homologous end joining protein LigD
MSLAVYKKRRNFTKTSEPKAKLEQGSCDLAFVIQKHQSSHLHYDLRLEIDGVLKSWAVPKGVSHDPKDKRLAIVTEDHPLAYKDFAGTIPEGEYGAGTVEIWDRGTYKNLRELSMAQSFAAGKIQIELHGKKITGEYTLIRIKNFQNAKKDADMWLIVKTKTQ